MRKMISAAVCFALASMTVNLNAQDDARPNGLSAKLLFIDHHTPSSDGVADPDTYTNGLEVAYNRYLKDWLMVSVPLKVGVINLPDEEFENNRTIGGLDACVRARYFKKENLIVPYMFTGVGFVKETDEDPYGQVPVGIGLDFRVGPWGYITLQSEYRLDLGGDLERANLQHGIGFTFMLGKPDPLPEEPIEDLVSMDDKDGDGVKDADDQCPNDKGTVEAKGCPDADGDTIADKDDQCPELAGPVKYAGCPDTDGDGVLDNADECPEVAGVIMGCPDADGDGVMDSMDKCPDQAGTRANAGCPDKAMDADGDGFSDNVDRCPDVAGKFNGCPDTDNDGLADHEDVCPTEAGSKANRGCPELKKEVREVLAFAREAVQFETGSANIKYESHYVLDKIAVIMNDHPNYLLKISGHTDDVGNDVRNKILSENRAKSCMDYLIKKGVSPLRLSYFGYGEEYPIADNKTVEGRKLNRRVEFDLTPGK